MISFLVAQPAHARAYRAKAKLVENASGHYLEFGHGYKAQLFIGTDPAFPFRSTLKLADSTCDADPTPITCSYVTQYQMNKVNWLWIQNPNPKRIGQPIEYRRWNSTKTGADALEPLDGNIAFRTFFGPLRHSKDSPKTLDVMTCPSFSWMPAAFRDRQLVTSWYSSNMATNSETGESENRALFAAVGVHIKIVNQTLELTDFDEVQTFGDFFIHPFSHDQQSMIFNDGAKSCQINWTRQVAVEENKKYFNAQMQSIGNEHPIPLKDIDFFSANQVKAGAYEFTLHEVEVQ